MNSHHTRRKLLKIGILLASLSLAGCSSNDSSDSSSDGSSGASGEPDWEELVDTRVEVPEDGYQSWSWAPDQSVEVKWDMFVRSGPEVELFVMESTEFDEYQAENRFRVFESEAGESGSDTFRLEDGNYRFVLDNTEAGDISPPTNFDDDVAEIELTIEGRPA